LNAKRDRGDARRDDKGTNHCRLPFVMKEKTRDRRRASSFNIVRKTDASAIPFQIARPFLLDQKKFADIFRRRPPFSLFLRAPTSLRPCRNSPDAYNKNVLRFRFAANF